MPHSLLTYEIQKCDAEIAKARGADKTHWEEEKEAYCMSLENLEMSIETSTITETEYVQRLSAAIKREEARAGDREANFSMLVIDLPTSRWLDPWQSVAVELSALQRLTPAEEGQISGWSLKTQFRRDVARLSLFRAPAPRPVPRN